MFYPKNSPTKIAWTDRKKYTVDVQETSSQLFL